MLDSRPDPRAELGFSEPHYVAWMRERQRAARRQSGWLSRRRAQPDLAHEERVDSQTIAWAQRHAHEQRLHDSAIEQLRHH